MYSTCFSCKNFRRGFINVGPMLTAQNFIDTTKNEVGKWCFDSGFRMRISKEMIFQLFIQVCNNFSRRCYNQQVGTFKIDNKKLSHLNFASAFILINIKYDNNLHLNMGHNTSHLPTYLLLNILFRGRREFPKLINLITLSWFTLVKCLNHLNLVI